VKKTLSYILLFFYITLVGNILWVANAAIWDIGHWRDTTWGQIPGTTFTGFDFNQEIRNDGIYTKPANDTIAFSEAGDYLIIATTNDNDDSNGRYNSQLKVEQISGAGELFTSHYSWYSRDNSEDESWTRAVSVVIGASAGSQIQVQKRRDTDGPSSWSIANASDVQVIRLDQTNHGIYNIAGTGNAYGGTTPNTVSIDSIVSESNTSAIEANLGTDTISVKWNNKKYLVAWSASFNGTGTRTQRIGHLEYDNIDSLSTRSYCYNRNGNNQYCGLGSMDLIETSTADINIQTEIFRGDGNTNDQWWANVDGTMSTDGNGQMIVLEMPDSLEAIRSEDSVGLQDVTSAQTLNVARNINFNDAASFTKNSDSQISVTNPADIFSWANVWTARGNVGAGARQTSIGTITVDGVEQTVWRHGNYSRWNQWSADTFAMSFHPAGIFTTTSAGSTIGVNSDPIAGWEAWGTDRTQPGTVGFFALNLDTLTPPPIDPAPGWVDTNLALWLKADEWTSSQVDGAWLTSWLDQSTNSLDATGVNAPVFRSNTNDELNFNPVVDFNGTSQYFENLANGAHSDSYYIVIVPDSDVEWTSSQWVPFGFNCTSWTLSAWGPCGLNFGGLALGAFTVTIPDEVITHAIGSSANYRSSKTAVVTFPAGKPMLIGVNDNAIGWITNIYEKWEQVDNAVRNTYQTLSNADYTLGRAPDNTYPFYYDGKIAEIINYDWGLMEVQRHKIESYLAIKYGMTLNNGTQNYIATDETIFWNTATNNGYNNDIFGVGRDDIGELGQIQSKSVNDGAIITLQAQWEWTNIANNFVDISNKEFLMMWNNAGSASWSASNTPVGFVNLNRTWKAEEVWETWLSTLSFDVDDINFDIPAPSLGTNYYFLLDSNNNGDLSDETAQIMTNTSLSNWSITWIDIDDGQIFTIASQASLNNIPTDIMLSSINSNENVTNGTTLGTLSTSDSDITDTHSYSFVTWPGDNDNGRFNISGNTVTFNHSPDHEIQENYTIRIQTDDGNGGTYIESFIIAINDLWEAITTTIDFEDAEDNNKYTVGSGQWNNNTINPNTGTNSLESDNSWLNNTQSCFQVEHNSNTDWFIEFDYEVSSQAGSDELRFFIDNVEQDQWSGAIPYSTYTSPIQTSGPHLYKWCYVKDGAGSTGTDNAYIDNINFVSNAIDVTAPSILSSNIASGSLLPGWNHSIELNYEDLESGIDTSSAVLQLAKWDGVSSYWPNIASSWITSLWITSTWASYTTNNLEFWKYVYAFQISDIAGNTSTSTGAVFYIDEPEFIVSTPEIDMGLLNSTTNTFSPTVQITVNTVGAEFDLIMNSDNELNYLTNILSSFDGTTGFWYQATPLSGTITTIWIDETIGTQTTSINTNGDKNTYIFEIQLGWIVNIDQAAGDYMGNIDFGISLTY